jgi:hypothetical protein
VNTHGFRVESDDDGDLQVVSQHGVLLGRVWQRTYGDDFPAKPYEAAITLEDDEGEDEVWPIAICATETEAIEAVIRWHVELMAT